MVRLFHFGPAVLVIYEPKLPEYDGQVSLNTLNTADDHGNPDNLQTFA